jgi:twinkle protein
MTGFIRDDIDWAQYERETDAKAKVRRASQFTGDLLSSFVPRERNHRTPEMFSTKLRGLVEFRPGEVTCWAGYNGHRKSMFTGQVALDLIVQHQRVLIASFEMSPAKTLHRMVRQAFGVARPSTPSIEQFAKWTDDRLWMFDHSGRINGDKMLAVCNYFAQELRGDQVFIDSMMMVCASEEHLDEQKQFVTDLVRAAKETQLHIHLVAHCRKPQSGDETKPPTKYDLRGSAAISDQVDNVALVWANKAKAAKLEKDENDAAAQAEPDALVSVDKQRNDGWEGRLKLWFHAPSLRFCDDRASPVEPYVLRDLAA